MINVSTCKRLWRYQSKRWRAQRAMRNDPILADILRQGFAVIPDYWSTQQCDKAVSEIDLLLTRPSVKVWRDAISADHRIMGAEQLSESLDLVGDPYINGLIEKLYGRDELAKFTMAAKLEAKDGNLGSGQGWHRDSAFVYQFKAIVYLTDVGPENGPFQYIHGSGNALSMLSLETRTGMSVDKNRFSDDEIRTANLANPTEFCAKRGTLLLVNTRGIHRGKPIIQGPRYALTNYYWTTSIPPHIAEFVN